MKSETMETAVGMAYEVSRDTLGVRVKLWLSGPRTDDLRLTASEASRLADLLDPERVEVLRKAERDIDAMRATALSIRDEREAADNDIISLRAALSQMTAERDEARAERDMRGNVLGRIAIILDPVRNNITDEEVVVGVSALRTQVSELEAQAAAVTKAKADMGAHGQGGCRRPPAVPGPRVQCGERSAERGRSRVHRSARKVRRGRCRPLHHPAHRAPSHHRREMPHGALAMTADVKQARE